MRLAEQEHKRTEKINGVLYNMSPAPNFRHGIISNNINKRISYGLENSLCLVFMGNLDFKYHPDENDDYLCPDLMIICDRKQLKGSSYSGLPKFIAEILSPSTAKRDRTEKKDIYEKAGVSEYWIVSPQGSMEIYYLRDGNYMLEQSYMLQNEPDEEEYNAETEICLREFPHITMTLGDIFSGLE
ncbi:MAG: Uma2 family endonuclease [Lachnospiraceae bacterium]|jgi:Uma2 family endonuclease|nr:Uma2 family endonuclease [Lachnospiraceae bacterium]MCI9059099.1 Uma2 family endonuclease [Lachnospiraceae bacterium]